MRFSHVLLATLCCLPLLIGPASVRGESLSSTSAQVSGSGLGDAGSPAGHNTRWAAADFYNVTYNRSGEAIGRAEVGYVAGYTRAAITPGTGPAIGFVTASVGPYFLLDGVVVTRLPGFEGLPATVETTAQIVFDHDTSFDLIDSLNGGLVGGTPFGPAAPVITSTATVTVGQPFSINLGLTMRSRVESVFETQVGQLVAALDPVEAFVLPEGYTANTPDGLIVDGGYTGVVRPVTGALDGDYNFDGAVDAADYTVWRDAFSAASPLPGDTTPDVVDTSDYDLWSNQYGAVASPATATEATGSATIPEPVAATLLLIAAASVPATRRRCRGQPR